MTVYAYMLNKLVRLLGATTPGCPSVHGDEQIFISSQDTSAAIPGSRSFRMLMFIADKHDLELKQYDLACAIIHASMYVPQCLHAPIGKGAVLKLDNMAGGFRSCCDRRSSSQYSSPRPWLQTVSNEACCIAKGRPSSSMLMLLSY